MTTKATRNMRRYTINSLLYLNNATTFLRQKEAGKASEFLWGSVAEAVKAVAASRGKQLRSHRSLRDFVDGLSKDTGEPSLLDGFLLAESLHSNFYEVEREPRDIAPLLGRIESTVRRLFDLIPEAALPQEVKERPWPHPHRG